MPTEVFYPIASPNASGVLHEAYPYGPNLPSGFNPDLGIEIDSLSASTARAVAVVPGLLRLIPDLAPATTCSVVLRPATRALRDLASVWGNSAGCFVYRNLDLASVITTLTNVIASAQIWDRVSSPPPLATRLGSFQAGDYPIAVTANQPIGQASSFGASPNRVLLGIEIVFLPGGVGLGDTSWNRLVDLTKPDATTRRLDPAAFYQSVTSGTAQISLAAADANHPITNVLTNRFLLELRDEYDQPYVGTAMVSANGGQASQETFTASSRGTVVLIPPAPVTTVDYSVQIANRVLTDLPSGDSAQATAPRTFTGATHRALQHIRMSDDNDTANWFSKDAPRGALPMFRPDCKVTPLVDGLTMFADMHNTLLTINSAEHYYRHAGWWMSIDFSIVPGIVVPGHPDSSMTEHLNRINGIGAQTRAMLWDKDGTQNTSEVNFIDNLSHGQAIRDNETLWLGSHHQKFSVIQGAQGAIGYCGGIDINSDRLQDLSHRQENPFHDVHARVEGQAVADLNQTFVERWNNHPDNRTNLPVTAPAHAASPGSHFVQVSRTYPPQKSYPFALSGDLSTLNTTRRAFQRARRYIYIEEQYLSPYPGDHPFVAAQDTVGLTNDLLAALARPSFEFLIICIPNNNVDQPQNRYRRRNFIAALRAAAPAKVHVFYPAHPTAGRGGREIYVHSKVIIVDDVFARIGSSNFSRRSMTHDSEIDVNVIDGALSSGARRMARNFRMELWGEHLNMRNPARRALLEDPTLGLTFWITPPRGARIRPYQESQNLENVHTPGSWNTAVDPDGR